VSYPVVLHSASRTADISRVVMYVLTLDPIRWAASLPGQLRRDRRAGV